MDSAKVCVEYEDGVAFLLDFARQLYYECDNPQNVMRLCDMKDFGSHYEFVYDPSFRNLAKDQSSWGSGDTGPYLSSLKSMITYHPYGMAECFGVEMEEVIGKTDKEFFRSLPAIRARQYKELTGRLDFNLLEARLNGVLPEIKIGEEVYTVKWQERALINTARGDSRIELSELCQDYTGHAYDAFLDMRTGTAVARPFGEDCKPFIYKASIPEPEVLDPVGLARQRGFADTDLLWRYPIQSNLEAKLTAVFESSLGYLKKNEPAKVKNNEKPNKRRRIGL